VEFQNLEIRYPSNPDVAALKQINVTIQPGEKFGIIGRTGSGKSTMASALLRIVPFYGGRILIDGYGKLG
jgi:ABC-type multidrug transport system fused ATPase/permease subunit